LLTFSPNGGLPQAAFIKGMRELGRIEGNDFIVEWRSAEER
jgi:hypothetical protein